MPVPTPLSFVGVAKESTRGTLVASTAYIPVRARTPKDLIRYLEVDVLKGAMAKVYGEVQGYKHTTFEAAGPVFEDTFGWPLFGFLGDITTTASRSVADAVTTSGNATVTSATAAFVAGDTGKVVTSPNLPVGTIILTVNSGTSITVSQNATASGGAQALTIGAPQSHVGSLLNSGSGQPTSHSLTDYYAVTQARGYAGIQWHHVEIKFAAEGLLDYTAQATGLTPSAQVTKPTQSFTAVTATPAWQGVVQIGGSTQAKTFDGTITMTRPVALIPGLNGTQLYAAVFLGPADVKFKLNCFIDDDTELLRMINNSQPPLNLNWAAGAGAASTQLMINMQQAAYTKAEPSYGKEYVAIDIEGTAVANSTDVGASGGFSPVKVLLGNNIASGTYI